MKKKLTHGSGIQSLRRKLWLAGLILWMIFLSGCPSAPPVSGPPTPPERTVEILVQGSLIRGSNGINFGPEGNLYIASVHDPAIVVMNPQTGKIIKKLDPSVGVKGPADLTFGPDGSLFWTDTLNGEVSRLSPKGELTTQRVAPGVTSITFSEDGRLFVALDFLGDALYELDPQLKAPPLLLLKDLGFLNGFDFGPDGLLYGPIWSKGQIVKININTTPPTVEIVAEGFSLPAALKFNSKGELFMVDHKEGAAFKVGRETGNRELVASGLHLTDNLAFDREDNLFVSAADSGFIGQVASDGSVRTVYAGGLISMSGLSCLPTTQQEALFVADLLWLHELSPTTGEILSSEKSLIGVSALKTPMTLAPFGTNLLISSSFDRTVQIWNPEAREVVATFTDFGIPLNAAAFQGQPVVVDEESRRILMGRDKGSRQPLGQSLVFPLGLASDSSRLWASDVATGRIYQLAAGGKILEPPRLLTGGLSTPEGMVVAPDGYLYVVEAGRDRVIAIDPQSGQYFPVARGLKLAPFPQGVFNAIAVSSEGTLFVTADESRMIYRLAPVVSN